MKTLKILFTALLLLNTYFTYSQSNQIEHFPFYKQDDDSYENDCGPWAIASILAYWNNNGQFPYTKFDRFLGDDFNYSDTIKVKTLAEELHDPLEFTTEHGTRDIKVKTGILDFCNDKRYNREYDFNVNVYGEILSINIWEFVKSHIDIGEPILISIHESTFEYAYEGMDYWLSKKKLNHFMPIIGYHENFIGEKTLIASSMAGVKFYLKYETLNTLVLNPWFWTLVPRKVQNVNPVCTINELSNSTISGIINLTSNVFTEIILNHVEYELQINGEEWTKIGHGIDENNFFEFQFNSEEIIYKDKVRFRCRAKDFIGNYSECSYSSFYTIDNSTFNKNSGTFKDLRDNREYKWVKIGNQIWMAENLAYLPTVTSPKEFSSSTPKYYVYNYFGTKTEDALNSLFLEFSGVLYNWPAALNACPCGWHLPIVSEWQLLESTIGLTGNDKDYSETTLKAVNKLKSTSGWMINTGTNESGFDAVPGGYARPGKYNFSYLYPQNNIIQGEDTFWWTATEFDNEKANARWIIGCKNYWYTKIDKNWGISVRCVKE